MQRLAPAGRTLVARGYPQSAQSVGKDMIASYRIDERRAERPTSLITSVDGDEREQIVGFTPAISPEQRMRLH